MSRELALHHGHRRRRRPGAPGGAVGDHRLVDAGGDRPGAPVAGELAEGRDAGGGAEQDGAAQHGPPGYGDGHRDLLEGTVRWRAGRPATGGGQQGPLQASTLSRSQVPFHTFWSPVDT
ncbi:hypothetical protein [Micromonospora sp. IBHARD004]|uniref:hypothetical protein n=1 Tax=Micromonospora sp. IBHARD004 TaxID=3457764 RepID=UPI00405A1E90